MTSLRSVERPRATTFRDFVARRTFLSSRAEVISFYFRPSSSSLRVFRHASRGDNEHLVARLPPKDSCATLFLWLLGPPPVTSIFVARPTRDLRAVFESKTRLPHPPPTRIKHYKTHINHVHSGRRHWERFPSCPSFHAPSPALFPLVPLLPACCGGAHARRLVGFSCLAKCLFLQLTTGRHTTPVPLLRSQILEGGGAYMGSAEVGSCMHL